jgi:hypothetical protein
METFITVIGSSSDGYRWGGVILIINPSTINLLSIFCTKTPYPNPLRVPTYLVETPTPRLFIFPRHRDDSFLPTKTAVAALRYAVNPDAMSILCSIDPLPWTSHLKFCSFCLCSDRLCLYGGIRLFRWSSVGVAQWSDGLGRVSWTWIHSSPSSPAIGHGLTTLDCRYGLRMSVSFVELMHVYTNVRFGD